MKNKKIKEFLKEIVQSISNPYGISRDAII